MSTAKASRNDLCPCGSGKKFKRCCAGKQPGTGTSKLMFALVVGVIAAALVFGVMSLGQEGGSAAAGQVWSAEHGHYHDVQ